MFMNNIYTVETTGKGCIDMSKPGSTTLCYRTTYADLKSGNHGLDIKNPFIVYILHAKNYEGKDYLYIGKSKNGISKRPTQHENKDVDWDMCYILTQFYERTMLNDGMIQYLEDIITDKAKETNCYNVLTQQTTKGTANKSDEVNCRIFLDSAVEMLYILGLDLKTIRQDIKKDVDVSVLESLDSTQYWVYAAGEGSKYWDEFYDKDIMGLGWNEIGDLLQYKTKADINKALKANLNPSNPYTHPSLMLYQFANEMKPGDVVFVKKGVHEIVGYGIVSSDYYYDDVGVCGYKHFRNVNWISKGSCLIDRQLAQKTLTNITQYKDYVLELNNLNFSHTTKAFCHDEKEVLINTLFTGKYTQDSNNIAHEIINIIKDDNNNYNLFITPNGKLKNHNIDRIIFVKNNKKPYVLEVVAIVDKLNDVKNDIITYNGKIGNEIFRDDFLMTYQTSNIRIPKDELYIGVKGLVSDDGIFLIDTDGKRITNMSMRTYYEETSDVYKQLEEIIESVEWEPLDTDKLRERFSSDNIFMQSYYNFMDKIK